MCGVCGCGPEQIGGRAEHAHDSRHVDLLRVEEDILARNDAFALENRRKLARLGVYAVNLVSSPGSGKTTLLVKTITDLKERVPVAVIEGDQQTSLDADRIRCTGAPTIQINTGRGCHLDAHMVGHAMDELPLETNSVLFIENVGNLVCPAGFDLGEAQKIAILSVTEGDDKPLKYPDIFAAASTVVISKIDLLPHVPFSLDSCLDHLRAINPDLTVLQVSATSGEGMDHWVDLLASAAENATKEPCHA